MQDEFDVLLSLAEVAATFAGFAALAGIIGHFAPEAARLDVERLKTVVIASVLVVVTALLPVVVWRFGVPARLVWQFSSGVALVLNGLALWMVARAGRRSGLHSADRLFTLIGYGLEIPVQLALIANLLLLFPDQAGALYLVFLYLCLCQAVLVFLLLIASLFRPLQSG